MDEFYLRNAKIMSALSTPMRLQILDISNTQIQEYVQQTRGVEKDKANAILASMRSGKGIALIGAFCPLLWMSILMGQSWGAILFNFCHSMLYVIIGLFMYFGGKKKLVKMMNEAITHRREMKTR